MSWDPVYWAAKPLDECAQQLEERCNRFYEWIRLTGQYAIWLRMIKAYYAAADTAGSLGVAGESEEYTTVHENHLHSLGENLVVMITGSRPNFEPRAKNSDHKSATQTVLGGALLDQAFRDKDLEGSTIEAVRYALQYAESFIFHGWDPNDGKPFVTDPESGRVIRTGDVKYRAYMPIDVVRDVGKYHANNHQWVILRDEINRYDLCAKFPALADKILAMPSNLDDEIRRPRIHIPLRVTKRYDSDDIVVWHFYHEPTDALPQGRYVQFCSGDLALFDGPLPYKWLPVSRLAPENMPASQRGYTALFDLLPLQHIVSSINSLMLSHVNNYGTGVYWTKPGGNISVADLKSGFTLLKSPEKPEVINPPPIPEYFPEMAEQKVHAMEALSGVNSVHRGTLPNEKAMSGAALALIDAKALEYVAGMQRSYVRALEQVATRTIQLYQIFGKAPQVVSLAGKSKQHMLQEFTGDDVMEIDRVTVDIGNPLSRTTSGRLSLAQMFLGMQPSPIRTPEQLEEVLSTGSLEPAIEGERAELLYIRAENEMLAEGEVPTVACTDMHPTHIEEHTAVWASPEARQDPKVVAAVAQHLTDHAMEWRTTDPAILMSRRCPPPPPLGMPPGPPMMQGAPQPGQPPNVPQFPPPATSPEQMNAPPGAGPQPSMPQMPKNPLDGQRAAAPIPNA